MNKLLENFKLVSLVSLKASEAAAGRATLPAWLGRLDYVIANSCEMYRLYAPDFCCGHWSNYLTSSGLSI